MSTCISQQGEYGSHIFDGETLDSRFVCARCFAFDEEAAEGAVQAAEARLAKVEALCDEAESLRPLHSMIPLGCVRVSEVRAVLEDESA